ncbi:mediator of RNA polymerase II transcription subunit 6-like [Sycon ciliatum]|uniref:mediator of RNA polymerase II transcription subunit 6-like n=1 Tax=Sycon ciliatum TaxID=27933 RepID=UPI0020AE2EB6|eukprot:scpid93822/ scgid9513/ Mediator of RNA polymerase II transcription subunit 6; Mediator complex subunit 6
MSVEKKLHLSWHDSAWIPILQPSNVLEYFSQRSNPFYDRTCNNEVVRMQRRELSTIKSMTGLEYELLHVQGNFLYIIRKQFRHSPTEVTPQANYYILNGVVYQAPDLHAVVNSRVFSALYHITKAFDEVSPRARYHPTSGYLWDFEHAQLEDYKKKEASIERSTKESNVQHQCVSMILNDVVKKFPPQVVSSEQATTGEAKTPAAASSNESGEGPGAPSSTEAPSAAQASVSTSASAQITSVKRSAGEDSTEAPAAKRSRLA